MYAPLPAPGTIVWIRQRRWRVESARRDRSIVRLDVADRHGRLTFLAPFDRPTPVAVSRRLRVSGLREAAARCAGLVARTYSARGLRAVLDAGVDVLPYQLEPALAMADGVRRVLVADEVGLGKTIQAALAIAELKRRRPAIRAMVVAPRAICEQWARELNDRFGIGAVVTDRDAMDAAARAIGHGRHPWTRSGVWIVSADYLKQPHVFDAIPLLPWDIVVVDEAHDACGDSVRHDAIDEMARRARHVMLLTATPHTGDAVRFQRLESLGRLPALDEPIVMFRRTRRSLGQPAARRVRWVRVPLAREERAVLDALTAFEHAVTAATVDRHREGALLLLSILRKRALSTMAALDVSIDRRLAWITGRGEGLADWIQPRLAFDDADEARADDDCAALMGESGLPAGVERTWLRRLRALVNTALRHDGKVRHIVRLLHRTREPVVMFTEFRHSLDAIRSALERTSPGGRRVATLHGGQSPGDRASNLERFLRGEASVLLATDVASQGLNLQGRARWVVSVELPWTPARIEQRVGRVDRIGQTRPVHASLIQAGHTAERGLLARLAARALEARRAIGPDTLAEIVPPSERSIVEALLTGRPLTTDDTGSDLRRPALVASAAWRRRAIAVARHVAVKRALNRRWRAPDDSTGRPRLAMLQQPRRIAPSPDDVVVVVAVPIVDATGLVAERHLLNVVVQNASPADAVAVVQSPELRAWLKRRFRARLARLARHATSVAAAGVCVDDAMARHLSGAGWPDEVQVGLFDRRAERSFTAARVEAADIDRELAAHRWNWRATSELDIGLPSVELVFCSRPPR